MKNKSLIPDTKGISNDCIMTSPELGKRIIEHFIKEVPFGTILEPCRGDGTGFWNNLKELWNNDDLDWCEIEEGKDFFNYIKKVDFIITNPPYSKLSDFLEYSFEIAENVVFLILIPAAFFKKRMRLAKEAGFGIKEIIYIDTPKKPFPQMGLQFGIVHWEKGYNGGIEITDWRE